MFLCSHEFFLEFRVSLLVPHESPLFLAIFGLGLVSEPVLSLDTGLHALVVVVGFHGRLDAVSNSEAGPIEIPCLGTSSLFELRSLEDDFLRMFHFRPHGPKCFDDTAWS